MEVTKEDFHDIHCFWCLNHKKCVLNPDVTSKCELINCHLKCGAIFHACKLQEHKLLCLNEKVPCYNRDAGCPCLMQRGLLASHLSKCPASVIHCTMEWNRRHISDISEKQLQLCKQNNEQNNEQPQLDIALALRDQRVLRQWYTSGKTAQKALRNHFKKQPRSMLFSKYSEDQQLEAHQIAEMSELHSNDWYNELFQAYALMGSFKAQILRRNSGNPSNKLSSCDFEENKENTINNVKNSHSVDPKDDGSCEILDEAKNHKSRYSDNESKDSSDLINIEKVLRIKDDADMFHFDENMVSAVIPHPTRYLGLNPNMEIVSHSLTKEIYTFLCCQEFRRDEYLWHYKNVHCEIHGGLNGWIQERCPLAQYGCTFSRQRLNPKPQGSKVVYNEVLESFGVVPPSPECLERPISPADENIKNFGERVKITSITQLPYEILRYIASFLDSFSLSNLSLTCNLMRDVCQSLLIEKGIVTLQWEKTKKGDSFSWEVSKKRWCFSSHFSPVQDWCFDDKDNMSNHLKNCPYFHRNVNMDPFHHIKGYISPEESLYQKLSQKLENVITKL